MATNNPVVKITLNETMNPSRNRTDRLEFDEAMMMSVIGIAQRATCQRLAVGCILTANRHIVATGFNGSVKGQPHCLEIGCMKHNGHCIACVHAEANACMRCQWADTAYLTDSPCITCLKLMLQKGVERIVFWRPYFDDAVLMYLQQIYGVESNWPLSQVDDRLSDFLNQADSNMKRYMREKNDSTQLSNL